MHSKNNVLFDISTVSFSFLQIVLLIEECKVICLVSKVNMSWPCVHTTGTTPNANPVGLGPTRTRSTLSKAVNPALHVNTVRHDIYGLIKITFGLCSTSNANIKVTVVGGVLVSLVGLQLIFYFVLRELIC